PGGGGPVRHDSVSFIRRSTHGLERREQGTEPLLGCPGAASGRRPCNSRETLMMTRSIRWGFGLALTTSMAFGFASTVGGCTTETTDVTGDAGHDTGTDTGPKTDGGPDTSPGDGGPDTSPGDGGDGATGDGGDGATGDADAGPSPCADQRS